MVPEEFYIRSESETEARGPFNGEQLNSLAEAGQVSLETLYYDASTEDWVAIGSNAEVKAIAFPEKKKLIIREESEDVPESDLNEEASDSSPPISVHDMLAAAEGRTPDTKSRADHAAIRAKAANIGRLAAIAALAVAAAAEVLPVVDAVSAGDVAGILTYPLSILGGLDLVLAVLLVLGVTTIYPFLRFRAAFGLGFVGLVYWTQGESTPVLLVSIGSVGLYLCTIFLAYVPVAVAGLAAIGGMGGYLWLILNS